MNSLEKKRLEIANDLFNKYGAKGYKASFEDEGASSEDISRAIIITEKANLALNIKVGGCEAIADIRQAKILGTKAIIAPMIETPYAMQKFLSAVKNVYTEEEMEDLQLGINIETITGAQNIEEILSVNGVKTILNRVTLGRVDFIGSLGISRSEINTNKVFEYVKKVFSAARDNGLETALGGGIDIKAIQFIKDLGDLLDFYETRYIVFKNDRNKSEKEVARGLVNAQKFEANYLEDMSSRYKNWSLNGQERCQMIKDRIQNAEQYIIKLDKE